MKDILSCGPDEFDDAPSDEWEQFRKRDGDFIGLAELKRLDLGITVGIFGQLLQNAHNSALYISDLLIEQSQMSTDVLRRCPTQKSITSLTV